MQAVIYEDMDSVGGKHLCRDLGESLAVVAAVEGNAYAVAVTGHILEDVVCQPLCGHGHHIFVHTVGTHTHHAAQAAGTEFKIAVKGIFKTGRIRIHQPFHLIFCFLVIVPVEPALGYFSEIFFHNIKIVDYDFLIVFY